jgi:hypothetical protein
VTSGRASPPAHDATAAHAHRERRAACCVERARRRDTPRTRRALPQGIQRLTRPGAANSTAVHVARGDAPPHQSPLNRRPRTPGTSHEASQFGRGLDPLTQCHPRCAAPRPAGQSEPLGAPAALYQHPVASSCGYPTPSETSQRTRSGFEPNRPLRLRGGHAEPRCTHHFSGPSRDLRVVAWGQLRVNGVKSARLKNLQPPETLGYMWI